MGFFSSLFFPSNSEEDQQQWDFWERVQSGEVTEPWKQTGWVNPTDYENYNRE